MMISGMKSREISMAYLIKGGNNTDRNQKKFQIIAEYNSLMYCAYEQGNEIAIIFSMNQLDFDGMTFKEAKQLAGENEVEPSFGKPYARTNVSGVIDLRANALKGKKPRYRPW